MLLNYKGCMISVEGDVITCRHDDLHGKKEWQLLLSDTHIRYVEEGKEKHSFEVSRIMEFQFEMGNGGGRQQDHPAAYAYMIFKDDPDPKDLFWFKIIEEYVLLNQTKAHEFCSQVLSHISSRYSIPWAYKLSIGTKAKQNAIGWVFLFFVVMTIIWCLTLR